MPSGFEPTTFQIVQFGAINKGGYVICFLNKFRQVCFRLTISKHPIAFNY
jgi:hypothetical protein